MIEITTKDRTYYFSPKCKMNYISKPTMVTDFNYETKDTEDSWYVSYSLEGQAHYNSFSFETEAEAMKVVDLCIAKFM